MSKYVSYESWEKCVFKIPYISQLESVMDKYGICDVHEDTASLLIFDEGGYIEEFKDGTYHVTLDRTDIYDKDLNVVKRALYNWCDGELFNLQNGYKFGHYVNKEGVAFDLQEFVILSDSYNAWLEKENLPKMDIHDLLYRFEPINGKHLTDTQRDTLRSYERMWTLIDDDFNKEDSPND
tara:strand:+ start:76 stop:615 length:540 start_codon:yes stop_codon:yes gene_type:complete